MVWCQRKKFELKQKMLWLYFFSLDKNYLRQICKTVSHKKAGQNLKKKTKYFSPPFFSSPKYPIFKCVHDIFYFFFPRRSNKPKVFQLGAEQEIFDWPQMMVFCCSVFHFPEASNTIIWHQSEKCFQFFAHLWSDRSSLLSYQFGLSYCGTSAFSGLVPSRLWLLQD